MTPNICIDFGPNPPGVDPGQDHNRSMRGPSPKDFFLSLLDFSPRIPLGTFSILLRVGRL